MKKFKCFLGLLFTAMLLAGCRGKAYVDTDMEDHTFIPEDELVLIDDGIFIEIKEYSLTSVGCILTVNDPNGYIREIDCEFLLEVSDKGQWEPVSIGGQGGLRTTASDLRVANGIETVINWFASYGIIDPGLYRLGIPHPLYDVTETGYYLYVEFDMEEMDTLSPFGSHNLNVSEVVSADNFQFANYYRTVDLHNTGDTGIVFSPFCRLESYVDGSWQIDLMSNYSQIYSLFSFMDGHDSYMLNDERTASLERIFKFSESGHYRVIFEYYEVTNPDKRYYISTQYKGIAPIESRSAFNSSGFCLIAGTDQVSAEGMILSIEVNASCIFNSAYKIRAQSDVMIDPYLWIIENQMSTEQHAEIIYLADNVPYEFEIDWSHLYGGLPPGKYELIKEYYLVSEIDEKHTLSVDFEITE